MLYQQTIARTGQRSLVSSFRNEEGDGEDFAYILSLAEDRLPHDLQKGWLAGSGSRVTETGPLKVDLILAEPRNSRQRVIAPIHLILKFNPDSGVLMFKPASPLDAVEFWGNAQFEELPFGQARAVTTRTTRIRLGRRAEYDLLLTVPKDNSEDYLFQLEKTLESRTDQPIRRMVNFTPSGDTLIFERIGICVTNRTLAAGVEGWVSEGYSIQGSPLAVKTFRLDGDKHKRGIENEYKIASRFRHSRLLTGAIQLWCEHDRDLENQVCSECHAKKYYHVKWYMSSVLAQDSLEGALASQRIVMSSELFRQCFHQTLEIIKEIQSAGYIHRDLSLRNILVNSYDPLELTATDFGKAVEHQLGDTHMETALGPVPLVAPEVWSLTGYREAIDIWSAAASLTRLLVPLPWGKEKVTKSGLRKLHESLSAIAEQVPSYSDLMNLLRSILRWNPQNRITLEEALEHQCFEALEPITTTESRKRPRFELTGCTETKSLHELGQEEQTAAYSKGQLYPSITEEGHKQARPVVHLGQSSGDGLVTIPFSEDMLVSIPQAEQISGDGIVTQPFSEECQPSIVAGETTRARVSREKVVDPSP